MKECGWTGTIQEGCDVFLSLERAFEKYMATNAEFWQAILPRFIKLLKFNRK